MCSNTYGPRWNQRDLRVDKRVLHRETASSARLCIGFPCPWPSLTLQRALVMEKEKEDKKSKERGNAPSAESEPTHYTTSREYHPQHCYIHGPVGCIECAHVCHRLWMTSLSVQGRWQVQRCFMCSERGEVPVGSTAPVQPWI